jgi:hypothetical protein
MAVKKKKSTGATGGKGQKPVEAAEETNGASNETIPQATKWKGYARKKTSEEWVGIVNKLVEQAKKGSYNHMKLLVEVSGIKDADKPAQKKRDGAAAILLKKLMEKERCGSAEREEAAVGGAAAEKRKDSWRRERDDKGHWVKREKSAGASPLRDDVPHIA